MIIALTVNNRPHYLRETLESWREVRGIETAEALFICEPGCPEAVELCEKADFFRWSGRVLLTERAGVLLAPWLALSAGFAAAAGRHGDFCVLAEEDMVVSTDALELLAWAAERYRADSQVLAVNLGQPEMVSPNMRVVVRQDHFNGWVWGTWLDRWAKIGPDWDKDYQHKGWDHRLNDHWVGELGYRCIAPAVTRSQHIGKEGGTHCTPEMFESLLAEGFQREVPEQKYRLGLYPPYIR